MLQRDVEGTAIREVGQGETHHFTSYSSCPLPFYLLPYLAKIPTSTNRAASQGKTANHWVVATSTILADLTSTGRETEIQPKGIFETRADPSFTNQYQQTVRF